jgi:hypothetical protein
MLSRLARGGSSDEQPMKPSRREAPEKGEEDHRVALSLPSARPWTNAIQNAAKLA